MSSVELSRRIEQIRINLLANSRTVEHFRVPINIKWVTLHYILIFVFIGMAIQRKMLKFIGGNMINLKFKNNYSNLYSIPSVLNLSQN